MVDVAEVEFQLPFEGHHDVSAHCGLDGVRISGAKGVDDFLVLVGNHFETETFMGDVPLTERATVQAIHRFGKEPIVRATGDRNMECMVCLDRAIDITSVSRLPQLIALPLNLGQ